MVLIKSDKRGRPTPQKDTSTANKYFPHNTIKRTKKVNCDNCQKLVYYGQLRKINNYTRVCINCYYKTS